MEFTLEAKVVLTLEHKKGMRFSNLVATDFNLEVSDNLERSQYLDKENLPTELGSKGLSNVLIQGLVGNIHFAHEKGFQDSATHIRWIISELERGVASTANIKKSTFKQ